MKFYSSDLTQRFLQRFEKLYPNKARNCLSRFKHLIGRYGVGEEMTGGGCCWDESDSILITYGDMVKKENQMPLHTLCNFAEKNLTGAIKNIHILPFSPYSSDDGFSVIDYREVDPALGSWKDIEKIGKHFGMMYDLVLNHCSAKSQWLKDYTNCISPYMNYFIEVDPKTDLSEVTRPRAHPLLAPVMTRDGKKHLWATFSHDQIDLDFSNPDVFFEFLDIIFLYITKGVHIIRLDAIAYLWKKIGTSCIHLDETHEVVKLLRDILDLVAPHVILLTETNVPHEENISYFGDGDEARMVYQFSLPPLLLHALNTDNATYLSSWAENLKSPPEGCTFFNFTASHDGIGVRPLEGIIPDVEINEIANMVRKKGGFVNYKRNTDGTESPYELNITYFDAMVKDNKEITEIDISRFLCSQAISMSLKGIPAVYFHSLVATRNWTEGVEKLGHNRAINRFKWNAEDLDKLLADKDSTTAIVFERYIRMLKVRSQQKAFHPDGAQEVIPLGKEFFALKRTSPDKMQTIICLFNMTRKKQELTDAKILELTKGAKNILKKKGPAPAKLSFLPYEVKWVEV